MPLESMKVGDSFRVPWDKSRWKSLASMLNSLRNYTNREEGNFVVRAVREEFAGEDGVVQLQDCVRVWKVLT